MVFSLKFNESIELYIGEYKDFFTSNKVYKLYLKRYINIKCDYVDKLIFKDDLPYVSYKKIIKILEKDSVDRNYKLIIDEKIISYISKKEFKINERSKMGIEIKSQNELVKEKFLNYKENVDLLLSRSLREKQMWDSYYMYVMKKCCNFSVPGSGKTSTILSMYAYLENKGDIDKIVMIGPKNSFKSWADEFENTFGEKKEMNLFNIHDYNSLEIKKRYLIHGLENKNLILINYESVESIKKELKKVIDNRVLLVLDEVHKIKSITGKRAKSVMDVSSDAEYIVAVTGTPIPNSYVDIENILNILYKEEYIDFFNFNRRSLMNPKGEDIEEINKKLEPFFCRTTKKDLGVPLVNEDKIYVCNATKEENRLFKILSLRYRKNRFALIIRILQLQSNPKMLLLNLNENKEEYSKILDITSSVDDIDYADFTDEIESLVGTIDISSKMLNCINLVEELVEKGKNVIVWCIFIDSINRLCYELRNKGFLVSCIYGSTNADERNTVIENFKNKKIQILITNPHTLAESISLHKECHDAIYYEYSYNLVHLLQSKDRIHRLGLDEKQYTQYHYLQTLYNDERSIDEKILNRLSKKEETMLKAIESGKLENGYMAEDDINEIFNSLGI
ncbi:MAG: DEAD/DEAH box helicase [bacterium]